MAQPNMPNKLFIGSILYLQFESLADGFLRDDLSVEEKQAVLQILEDAKQHRTPAGAATIQSEINALRQSWNLV